MGRRLEHHMACFGRAVEEALWEETLAPALIRPCEAKSNAAASLCHRSMDMAVNGKQASYIRIQHRGTLSNAEGNP